MRSPAICMLTRSSMKLASPCRTAQLEDVRQALRVLLQQLEAEVLDGRLPGIAQRRGEEDERGEGRAGRTRSREWRRTSG